MPKDPILRNQTLNLALMKEMLKNVSETVTLKNLVSIGCNTSIQFCLQNDGHRTDGDWEEVNLLLEDNSGFTSEKVAQNQSVGTRRRTISADFIIEKLI